MSFITLGIALAGQVVTTNGDMDDTNFLPQDLAECQTLLLAAFKQSVQLEQQVAESAQQVEELERVLDETAETPSLQRRQAYLGRTWM